VFDEILNQFSLIV